jgi:hypothetical protein
MALSHSPQTVTNGLVFYYDMGNPQKSWKGAPTENLISLAGSDSAIQRSGTAYPFYNVGLTSLIQSRWTASNNVLSMSFEGRRNLVSGGTGNGGDGYPVAYVYFTDWSWASSVGISTYDWSYTSQTFTMPDPAGKGINFDVYHMNAGNPGLSFSRNHQVEFGPRSTPFVNGTRSNTQAILDLTNNNTVTANGLTYASDGTFSFNGSSNYLSIPNTTLGNGNIPWTVSSWVKTTTTANELGHGSVLSNISSGPVYSMMGVNNGKIVYWTYQSDAWAKKLGVGKTVNDGNWHMLTWVNYANYTMDMYVDGMLDSNVANSTSGNNNPVDVIGRSWSAYFPGSIGSLTRYTRALTAAEVQQNFNALRGRYGL